VAETQFLLLVGTYRSGTTSIFRYLSDHPQVSPSALKETGYFLPRGEPAPSRWGIGGHLASETLRMAEAPLDRYLALFGGRDDAAVRVEATPTYLYYRDSAEAMRAALPDCRVLITLRDPFKWIVSVYKLFIALRVVDESFDGWIRRIVAEQRPIEDRPFELRTLAHGRFASHVEGYREVFGADRVMVAYFEDLVSDSRELLAAVARFAGIDDRFYGGYTFTNVNPVRKYRKDAYYERYAAMSTTVARGMHAGPPVVRNRIQRLEQWALRRYEAWATEPVEDPYVGAEVQRRLVEQLGGVASELTALLGSAPPWQSPSR